MSFVYDAQNVYKLLLVDFETWNLSLIGIWIRYGKTHKRLKRSKSRVAQSTTNAIYLHIFRPVAEHE